jgi:hypothetical protein
VAGVVSALRCNAKVPGSTRVGPRHSPRELASSFCLLLRLFPGAVHGHARCAPACFHDHVPCLPSPVSHLDASLFLCPVSPIFATDGFFRFRRPPSLVLSRPTLSALPGCTATSPNAEQRASASSFLTPQIASGWCAGHTHSIDRTSVREQVRHSDEGAAEPPRALARRRQHSARGAQCPPTLQGCADAKKHAHMQWSTRTRLCMWGCGWPGPPHSACGGVAGPQ